MMHMLRSFFWVIKLKYRAARAAYVFSLLYYVYDGVSSILTTYVVAKLIAAVSAVAFGASDTRSVYLWLIALFGLEVVNSALRSLNRLIEMRAGQKFEIAINELYFQKLYHLSQEQFEDESFNTMAARAREALMQIARVTRELNWAISNFVRFVGAMSVILFISPLIGVLIVLAVIPIAIIRVRQNRMTENAYKTVEPTDRVAFRSRWLLIDPNYMPEVRIINAFGDLIKYYKKNIRKSQDVFYANEKKVTRYDIFADTFQPLVSLLANIYFFRQLVAGAIGFDRFIFLRGVLEQASSAAVSLASSFETFHEISINLDNFNRLKNAEPSIPHGSVKVTAPLTIEFKNVSFAYPGTHKNVVKDASFVIAPGSKLALVGENGAGKSTLIKLLLRQYLPSQGQILVNGHDMKEIDGVSYLNALSILSQDFLIVHHLSIKDNLTIGLGKKPTDNRIFEVLDLVGGRSFVEKLPHKLAQRLDSSFKDGTNLSGGQKQRLGVARALLRSGDILILDEPTSAIDAKAEYEIFNNIYKSHEGKTTLIVSHRFSTVRQADKVIVLEQGKIIEYGSHDELIAFNGLYKEMFDVQAEGYK